MEVARWPDFAIVNTAPETDFFFFLPPPFTIGETRAWEVMAERVSRDFRSRAEPVGGRSHISVSYLQIVLCQNLLRKYDEGLLVVRRPGSLYRLTVGLYFLPRGFALVNRRRNPLSNCPEDLWAILMWWRRSLYR